MSIGIELRTIAPRTYVGVRRKVDHSGVGPACAEILPRTLQWLIARGVSPDGAPVTIYHSGEGGMLDIQPGFFVTEAVTGEGDITRGETAGGEALVAVHVGPYQTLGTTWHAVFARAEELGRKVTQASWELYVDDPGAVDAAHLRTEIYVPLDPA